MEKAKTGCGIFIIPRKRDNPRSPAMDQRTFHGKIEPEDIASALAAEFNHGNLQTQTIGNGNQLIVQIASRAFRNSGGQTALTVTLQKVEDGVLVQIGNQQWLGVAASLGETAIAALRNPLLLLGRLDDLAQDISSIQLTESVWQTIQNAVHAAGAGMQISDRLRRVQCSYCGSAAPVGDPACPACGAPLGAVQPKACTRCGFIPPAGAKICPNCRNPL
jgi:RNA polymerase subunit RPABC4/transcription elongation factor Spt4